MKKHIIIPILAVILLMAQTPVQALDLFAAQIQTKYYKIISEDSVPPAFGQQMESLFQIFNRVFMFNPDTGSLPLKVRVFTDTDAYNAYIESANAPLGHGALYLHYTQTEKRELVVDLTVNEKDNALPYQACIQYLRAFIAYPPLWMQNGFYIFFSNLTFNNNNELEYEENLSWLPFVKKMIDRPTLEEIMLSESGEFEHRVLAASLVSFFMNCGIEKYTRSFTDSMATLSPENSVIENAQAVKKRLFLGCTPEELTRDYERYISSRKTFSELTAEGQKAYASGDMAGAELSFRAALEIKSSHFLPWYFLGLLAYNANDYYAARRHYHNAIERGADKASVFDAIGINAASAGNNGEAVDYLRRAAQADPDRYFIKSEIVIQQLR